jgi:hypothetical protein
MVRCARRAERRLATCHIGSVFKIETGSNFSIGINKHRGEWVAWSPDGRRVVAASRDPDALDDLVRAAGEDPENCPIEGIPDADCVIGGLDVS